MRFQFELNCAKIQIQMLRLIFRQIASDSHCNVQFDEKNKPKYGSILIVLNAAQLLLIIHVFFKLQIEQTSRLIL